MEFDEIVVKESPGLCRCCLSEGCYKDMGSEYNWMNETEIYAEMLLDCFDVSISQHAEGPNGASRLICEVCITRLRDACNFKKQVLDSEKKFIDMVQRGEFASKVLIYQSQMKAEPQPSEVIDEGEVEYLEDLDFGEEEPLTTTEIDPEEPSVSEVALAPRKRGRPRKNPAVPLKTEKKTKIAKREEKPRASKSVNKEHITEEMECKLLERQRRDALIKLLTVVIENSTVMPFKWSANQYMCFYCCCPFLDSSRLKQHMRDEHHKVKLKNVLRSVIGRTSIKLDISELSCKLCPKQVQTLEELLDHIYNVHDLKFDRNIAGSLFAFQLSDDDMRCLDCGLPFRFFGPLLAHVHKYHSKMRKFLCEICGQGFIAKANVDSHIRNVHCSQYQCKTCDALFPSLYALYSHQEKVHRSIKLKCPKCPEVLASKYLKNRHLALVHDVKTVQFNCDQCPKIFTLRNKLVEHTRRVHLKEKSLACEICGFRVFSRDLLKRHMVKHDDSRPFECEFCKKSFQRKKTLDFHRRIHTNDRRYACKACGKAFIQVTSLKLHVKVHHSACDSTAWT